MSRKTWLDTFTYKGTKSLSNDEWIETYELREQDYRVIFESHGNEWGGKSIITVEVLPVYGEKVDYAYHMRAPVISFFATGFEDFNELQKKIVEEIVPSLKKWAIKVL